MPVAAGEEEVEEEQGASEAAVVGVDMAVGAMEVAEEGGTMMVCRLLISCLPGLLISVDGLLS